MSLSAWLKDLVGFNASGGGLTGSVFANKVVLSNGITATYDATTETLTLATPTPPVLPSWHTVVSTDFATYDDLDMRAESTYTIGGVTWNRRGGGLGENFQHQGLRGGVGLALMPVDAGYAWAQLSSRPPCIRAPLETLLGSHFGRTVPLRATMVFQTGPYANPNSCAAYLALMAEGTSTQRAGYLWESLCSGDPTQSVTQVSIGTAVSNALSPIANASTNNTLRQMRTVQIELPSGFGGPGIFRGTYSGVQRDIGRVACIDPPSGISNLVAYDDIALGVTSNWHLELGFSHGGHSDPSALGYGPPVIRSVQLEAFY